MKFLYLIRHAKSDWGDIQLKDFDRHLSQRGMRDAPFMAAKFKELFGIPQKLISSPAMRAMTTANFFAKEFGIDSNVISYNREIYSNGQKAIPNIISQLDDSIDSVAVFGHNPDITLLANELIQDIVGHVPTCTIIKISFETEFWSEVSHTIGQFEALEFPKKYFSDANDD